MTYASFGKRFVAVIIDGLLLSIPIGITVFIFGDMAGQGFGTLLQILYYAYFESSEKQATIGKSVMNIKVVDITGQRISFPKALVRYISKYLSALILMIGFIMAAFTDRHQALHDMIAGTLVVNADRNITVEDLV